MIFDEDDELEHVKRGAGPCSVDGCPNPATWRTASSTQERGHVTMCGWHVMYGGSEWSISRGRELSLIGRSAKTMAEGSGSPNAHVPILDAEGRFVDPGDAEKFLLGVKYTTLLIKRRLGRIMTKGAPE